MKGIVTLKWTLIWFLILAAAPAAILAQSSAGGERTFSQEELDTLLAPIALYPDSLLAQVLVAATYPNEVLEADRWVKENPDLSRSALNDALDKKDWDLSVKALVPFPQVLAMMSEKIDWTEDLGDAFLAREDDVVDTIQTLRARARAQGRLSDGSEQRVVEEDDTIQIEPVNQQLIYVPVYDPCWVYGSWWWPQYPAYCVFPGAGYGFAAGVWVGSGWYYGWGHWDWHHHHHHHRHHDRYYNHRYHGDRHHSHLITNVNRHANINRNFSTRRIQTSEWKHDANRRGSATYRNTVSRQPAGPNKAGSPDGRRSFRGYGGQASPNRGSSGAIRQDTRAPQRGTRPTGESTYRNLQRGGGATFGGSGVHGQVRQQSERGAASRGSGGGRVQGGSGRVGGFHGSPSHGGGSFRGSGGASRGGGSSMGGGASRGSGGFHGGGSHR